ncbi:MAG TPA: SusC/RagA family TonB-linked outer membrane protein, partial [Puia sp.]|nr:SusC/RagA family TonB-linked outer membrane protein [Puia sp.]
QPVFNAMEALEGRVPGLLVTSTSGVPGSALQIQVRGQNTLGKTPGQRIPDNPFIIIDGVPFGPQNNSFTTLSTVNDLYSTPGTAGTGLSPLSTINPADIESIEVLKDADATAIYGARGANGVILITTRKTATGKPTLSTNVYTGFNSLSRTLPMLKTPQYLAMRRQAFLNDGLTPDSVLAPDLFYFDSTRQNNFLHQFFGGSASSLSVNTFLSGGNTMNTFSLGVGYDRTGNLFPGNFANNRESVNARLHHNSANHRLNIDFSSNFSFSKDNVPGSPSVNSAFTLPPNFPALMNPDGSLLWILKGVNLSDIKFSNPLAYLRQTETVDAYNLVGNLQLSYELLPGLVLRSNFGYNSFNTTERNINPLAAQDPTSPYDQSSSSLALSNNYTWTIEPQLGYNRKIGLGRMNLLAGATFQNTTSNVYSIFGTNYTNDVLLNSINSAGTITATESSDPYKYNGAFGRANYIYDNKYIIDLTGRMDGSSRFLPGKQWGHFGAIGAGWIFSEEAFWKRAVPFISYGKIRGSYGTTGNDNVGNYQYQSNWSSLGSNYNYNGSIGYSPLNLANPNYSWSTTKKTELGMELGILGERLLISADWFMNRSGNQLVQYTLPNQAGFGSVTKNFEATVQNTGVEFALSSTNIKTKTFTWKSAFNLSIDRNKLAAFPNLESSPYYLLYTVGKPLSTSRGYKFAGINDTTGVYQFYTAKGAKTYTPSAYNGDNQFLLPNSDPSFYGGLRNTFSYKGFQLDIFLEFRKQKEVTYVSSLTSPPGFQSNVPVDALDAWQKPGDHAKYQKL